MELVFVDRECSVCGGEGCDHCQGTGIQGECVEMPDLILPEPSQWAKKLRAWRLAAELTLIELSILTGFGVGALSQLENSHREPTDAERIALNACMEGWQ